MMEVVLSELVDCVRMAYMSLVHVHTKPYTLGALQFCFNVSLKSPPNTTTYIVSKTSLAHRVYYYTVL